MVCGPLERLSLGGVLCGCLESQDQFYYRLAYLTLQSQQVRWFRRLGQYNLQNANTASSKADNGGGDNHETILNATYRGPPGTPRARIHFTADRLSGAPTNTPSRCTQATL